VFRRGPTARDTGDAQADHGGVAISGIVEGDVNTVTIHMVRPVTWPVRVGVVPPEADCYQPRIVTGALSAITSGGGTAVLCQVLSGLGGVGKTQLAATHARQLWEAGDLDLMVWVPAASRSAIVAGYAQAHTAATGLDVPDAERAASLLLAWLASTERSWLIVLDDLTDPGDLRDLWPPNVTGGRTMVTTRRRDSALSGAGRTLIDVDLFTPDEAEAYLAARLAARPHLGTGGAGLARDLGYLPLAVAQATAYLIDRGLTCAEYAERLSDRRRSLADLLPELGALPDDHKATVAATWSLSIELADSLEPAGLARPALELASLLDPAGIPEQVFTTDAAARWLSDAARREVNAESARDALYCLHRLSLATLAEASTSRSLRVHPLIQRATRDQLSPDRLDLGVRIAADALVQVWPAVERDPEFGQALRASTATLVDRSADSLWTGEDGGHPVLFRAGNSLGEVGQAAAAANYFEHLHSEALQHLGADHPDTLAIRHNLARWRGEAGDAPGAATAFEKLLTDHMRVLGADNLDTLATRHDLAYWRCEAGDATGAAAAFEEVLSDRMRVLDADHPDTLATRHYLASWRGEAGDAASAAAALEEVLSDRLRVLGADHPDTLATRHNLAYWRGKAGDATGAAAALEELLNDLLRVLGADHPDTLTTRGNLASMRREAGDATGAAAAFEEVLSDHLRVLGADHPDTLTTRHNLAYLAGDAARAATAFEELLSDRLRVLGADHPDTLATRHNVVYLRGQAGDPAGAAAAFEELLTDLLRVLGPDHPDTLAARHNLAYWRRKAGMTSAPTSDNPVYEK
jgi:hypothetical protein